MMKDWNKQPVKKSISKQQLDDFCRWCDRISREETASCENGSLGAGFIDLQNDFGCWLISTFHSVFKALEWVFFNLLRYLFETFPLVLIVTLYTISSKQKALKNQGFRCSIIDFCIFVYDFIALNSRQFTTVKRRYFSIHRRLARRADCSRWYLAAWTAASSSLSAMAL